MPVKDINILHISVPRDAKFKTKSRLLTSNPLMNFLSNVNMSIFPML